jgi:hypothetical protein
MKINIPFENYSRLDLILKLVDRTNAVDYLEIGCDKNQIFNHILCKNKIGVDPNNGGTHRMTSDKFFLRNNNLLFDIIFIDGLHHYEQVTRDVTNSLLRLKEHGYIIIHDMLPVYEDEASMPGPIKSKFSPYWLGDVWRLGFDLMAREDISFKLIAIDCGCGIITKTPQKSKIINHENTWQWYADNWRHLPIVKYSTI